MNYKPPLKGAAKRCSQNTSVVEVVAPSTDTVWRKHRGQVQLIVRTDLTHVQTIQRFDILRVLLGWPVTQTLDSSHRPSPFSCSAVEIGVVHRNVSCRANGLLMSTGPR